MALANGTSVTSSDSLIEIRGLSVELEMRKRTVHAVNDVSLALSKEETLGLVGESGSGKTMMSLAIMGLLPAPIGKIVAGEVIFDGKDLTEVSDSEFRKIRGDQISMIFQEPMTSLDPLFTVGSQIVEAIRAHRELGTKEARSWPSRCSSGFTSLHRASGSRATPTSSPAACASGR